MKGLNIAILLTVEYQSVYQREMIFTTKQNNARFSVSVAGSNVRLNEKGLLMPKATPTALLLYCMRRVGYRLLSQQTACISTDLESTCQVNCKLIKKEDFPP